MKHAILIPLGVAVLMLGLMSSIWTALGYWPKTVSSDIRADCFQHPLTDGAWNRLHQGGAR